MPVIHIHYCCLFVSIRYYSFSIFHCSIICFIFIWVLFWLLFKRKRTMHTCKEYIIKLITFATLLEWRGHSSYITRPLIPRNCAVLGVATFQPYPSVRNNPAHIALGSDSSQSHIPLDLRLLGIKSRGFQDTVTVDPARSSLCRTTIPFWVSCNLERKIQQHFPKCEKEIDWWKIWAIITFCSSLRKKSLYAFCWIWVKGTGT